MEFVSGNVERVFGYKADDFLSGRISYNKLVHPEDIERVSQEVTDATSEPNRTEFSHAPYQIIAVDGSSRWVKDHTFIRRDYSGAITHFQGIVADISAERQSAYQLATEKERLAVTLRSIGDAVITTDRQGRIDLMNPIAENLTGWDEAEAIGLPLLEVFKIINETTRKPCENPVDKVLSTGLIVGLANHTTLIAKDGREFYIADSGAPIRDIQEEISGVVLVFRDVTEQQRIDKEMQKMERLESLGVLAGGIAHDFNNFLTGILGNLSLARLDIQPGNMLGRTLDEIEKAAIRAKALTLQLLTFSKGGQPVKHISNIANLVREATEFALRGSNVYCDLNFDQDLRLADVDQGQIAQVFHNLMINANQGMPDGGTVFVRGRNITLSTENQYALEPGEYIQLTIRDQGIGIHPDHQKKIFDPYFTTKKQGNGLGLTVAYSIITKHDGQLTVDSTLGEGTMFTVLLPVSDNTETTDTENHQELIIGHGRILVMDDEEFVREVTAALLEKMGYEVILAEDGDAAVVLYRDALKTDTTFDAVILDLTVPGAMGGLETVRQLTALDPNVRAIVSSGYSNDSVMANLANFGFRAAVKKPYQMRELSLVLNDVLKG